MKKIYWKTAQNRILDVDSMSEAHVRNVLKMLITKYGLGPSQEEINTVVSNFITNVAPIDIFGYDSKYNYIQ